MLHFIPIKQEAIERLDCGLLLGHIKLMWRFSLDYWNDQTRIPAYFEYQFGIEVQKELLYLKNSSLAYDVKDDKEQKTFTYLTEKGLEIYLKHESKLNEFEIKTIYQSTTSSLYKKQEEEYINMLLIKVFLEGNELRTLLDQYQFNDFLKLEACLVKEDFPHYSRP